MPPSQRFTGTIGIAGQDAARFSRFAIALRNLDLPPGTVVQSAFNYDLAHARNKLVKEFRGDWLFLLDDDHDFDPGLLRRLLHGFDPGRVVGALCLGRRAPFRPCPRVDGRPLVLEGEPRLVRVDETGGSGMLIPRAVLERLPWPCFAHGSTESGGHEADDQHFCRLLREAGVPIFVNTAAVLSHLAVCSVLPVRGENGGWYSQVSLPGGASVYASVNEEG